MLTALEEIELKYLQAKGFKYIARHHIGSLEAFKEKPVRNYGPGHPTWVIGSYPIQNHTLYHELELDKYEFIKWEDEPMEIDKLLRENGWDIPLVYPEGIED